jgi:hypothetical protein
MVVSLETGQGGKCPPDRSGHPTAGARYNRARPPGIKPIGTKLQSLPPGKGRALVEASCLTCHSADILTQQRLTEKQWAANLDKMIRWGAAMKESDKPAMVAYLARHFGPENKFAPIRTRPVGK